MESGKIRGQKSNSKEKNPIPEIKFYCNWFFRLKLIYWCVKTLLLNVDFGDIGNSRARNSSKLVSNHKDKKL